jgi:hypothetical protein
VSAVYWTFSKRGVCISIAGGKFGWDSFGGGCDEKTIPETVAQGWCCGTKLRQNRGKTRLHCGQSPLTRLPKRYFNGMLGTAPFTLKEQQSIAN